MKNENESFNFPGGYSGMGGRDSDKPGVINKERYLGQKPVEANKIFPYSHCLVDHSGRQFICYHDNCLKHSHCVKNKSPADISDFQALHFHPDDKALLCEKILPDILKFMAHIPSEESSDYRLSFNHRYIRRDGTISQFLQEGTLILPGDESLPVLNLRVFTEIGDFKTDETMILSIFRYSADQGYQKVYSKVYGNNEDAQLSQREIEIIKLCLEGLSSKMIAARLNLSIHTVKNHKRNCMEKTLTHNIGELIHFCMRSHLL